MKKGHVCISYCLLQTGVNKRPCTIILHDLHGNAAGVNLTSVRIPLENNPIGF